MFLLSVSGMGALSVRNTETGEVTSFPTMEAVVVAHEENMDQCAWADPGSARDYYFFDFAWGEAMEAVTVVVGEARQPLTVRKPAHVA